jgi:hypothetical protein
MNYWSRKFHIHLGLLLLFFVWLFSLSGLLLNHGHKWLFTSFWDERKEIITVVPVHGISYLDSSALLKTIMQQLNISGEVSRVTLQSDSLDFRVSIPGHERDLHVNFKNGTCTQKELIFNVWGKIRTLHTFNGYNTDDPDRPPNWIITRIWQFAKDIIAIGFIILTFTSWVMWFKIRKRYKWGLLFLLSGFAISMFFIFH